MRLLPRLRRLVAPIIIGCCVGSCSMIAPVHAASAGGLQIHREVGVLVHAEELVVAAANKEWQFPFKSLKQSEHSDPVRLHTVGSVLPIQ